MAMGIGAYGSIIGAGGGFLLIPGLALLFGLDGAEAVGTGVVTLACLHAAGAWAYDRKGVVVRPVAAWWALGAGPVALLSGWLLTNRLDSDLLLTLIGLLMIALAVFVVVRSVGITGAGEAPGRTGRSADEVLEPRVGALLAGATGVGFLNGAFAVGGGLVAVPYLARVQQLTAHRAAATTAAASMVASSSATVGHTLAGNIVWTHAPILMLGAIIGSSTGARVALRLPPRGRHGPAVGRAGGGRSAADRLRPVGLTERPSRIEPSRRPGTSNYGTLEYRRWHKSLIDIRHDSAAGHSLPWSA